jgi:hypothetical protein
VPKKLKVWKVLFRDNFVCLFTEILKCGFVHLIRQKARCTPENQITRTAVHLAGNYGHGKIRERFCLSALFCQNVSRVRRHVHKMSQNVKCFLPEINLHARGGTMLACHAETWAR